ncbi:ABC transporter permease [Anaeromicropila herbilytica]|uniref:Membrane protein n=1 Tax=Anaeromicropila herbilytica TaxID=2785025 RepID=A0A7R7IF16_9FIRM|nr:ABC transporter permease [Anaeromicropila herbilytica]BCN32704.1 membrane protein [Anaeromicropila herbilytica]
MSMRKTLAIFQKQIKDTFKNKAVFIQFIMFPAMGVIMKNAVKIDGMPENYFIILFASMYLAMAPITCMAEIIAEEKEKNTLRVLLMSNVKPAEYLIGVGSYIWLICMLGSIVFAITGDYKGASILQFLLIMAIGIMISTLIGAAIGTWSKNQMTATSITVPVMIIFSFLPMLSTFNSTIKKFGTVIYSEQINLLMNDIGNLQIKSESVIVIIVNLVIMLGLFVYAYRRSGLA